MMIRSTYIFFIGLFGIIDIFTPVSGNSPVLACYVYGMGKERLRDFDPSLCTHIVYYDVKITFNEIAIISTEYNDIIQKFDDWKTRNSTLQIIVSAFFDMRKKGEFHTFLAYERIHSKFISSLIQFLIDNNLDGFNLRYNYVTRTKTPTQLQSFLQTLSNEMQKNNKILTMTIASCSNVAKRNYIKYVGKYFRFIFVMCGDYDRDYIEAKNLNRNTAGIKYTTANTIIEKSIGLEFNLSSLVLGIEIQAHVYKTNKFLRKFSDAVESYDNVCQMWKNQNERWTLNRSTERSCLLQGYDDGINITEIFYNSPLNMETKVEYVRHYQIAGVMVWPINSDDVLDKCEEESNIFRRSFNYPILRTLRIYVDGILTNSWPNGFSLSKNIDSTTIVKEDSIEDSTRSIDSNKSADKNEENDDYDHNDGVDQFGASNPSPEDILSPGASGKAVRIELTSFSILFTSYLIIGIFNQKVYKLLC